MHKKDNKIFYLILIIASIILLSYASPYITSLKKATISDTCDFTIKSIDEVKTLSNDPTLNNEKVYLLNVRADKGNECLKVTLTQDDFTKFGITDTLYDNITLSAQVQDLSLDYKVEDNTILYKIYESTASADLSEPIPYSSVSLKTTQLSALGKFSDPNGQAPPINHLGNFPAGGDVNLMRDVAKMAYAMREASNIPFGVDKSGNWWVTHLGGVPFYRGYRIDTMAYNKYKVLFTLDKGNEQLASVVMDEQNRVANLGDVARIKFIGSSIDAVFPPQPSRYYYVVQGLEGTPVKGQWKFVSSERYERYKTSLDAIVNFDPDYFGYSYADMDGTLIVSSVPSPVDVYIDSKYIGFTPLTVNEVPIGRHTITAKKTGYYDANQEINLNPTTNNLKITLAQIAPPDVMLTINPTTVVKGNPATLSWSVKGVFDRVKLYDPSPSIVESVGTRTVYPTESITYVVEAIGAGGEKSASVRLGVVLPPPPEVSVIIIPSTITTGGSSTLTWVVNGDVSQISLYDPLPRSVSKSGSISISPQSSMAYTVEAVGQGGKSFATARLQVNPPPPPPPPPPPRRDPADSKAIIAIYENELNNMLGLMYSETDMPRDCKFNKDSLTVTCRPQLPVAYPEFQIIIKASAISMQINAGKPEITNVTIPTPVYEGTYTQALVSFKNIGIVSDTFDVSLQSTPALSGGTQQFSLSPQQSTTVSIPFSGAEGIYKAQIVVQSRNNPLSKSFADVEIKILKKPLPEEITRLEKQTDWLEDLVSQGYSLPIQSIIGILLIIGIIIFIKHRRK